MNLWQRFWRAVGDNSWFTPAAKAVVPLDRAVSRLTKGRVVALGMTPSLLLTTTGRRSGQPRSVPLQYLREGDGFVVVGSNWGQQGNPHWVHNLLAKPEAVVTVGGRDVPVRAEEADGAERQAYWDRLVEQWPGYRGYEATAGNRKIRIFRLRPL
jgi:deazaflavin-dependent oxidoreductase (nitroreductase family)